MFALITDVPRGVRKPVSVHEGSAGLAPARQSLVEAPPPSSASPRSHRVNIAFSDVTDIISCEQLRKPSPNRPELRGAQRQPLQASAWLRQDQASARVQVLDLSGDGAKVASDLALDLGSRVLLRCYLDGAKRPLSTWGQVARCARRDDGSYELGLHFHALSQRVKGQVQTYLQRYAAKNQALLRQQQQRAQRSWSAQFGL